MSLSPFWKKILVPILCISVGAGTSLIIFWSAGRYQRPDFMVAQCVCFLIGLVCARICFVSYKKGSKSFAYGISVFVGLATFSIAVMPKVVAYPIFMEGFRQAVLAAAPVPVWQTLNIELAKISDPVGRIDRKRLPACLKNVFPSDHPNCSVLIEDPPLTNPSPDVIISWRSFEGGIVIGHFHTPPKDLISQFTLGQNVFLFLSRDE